jgi:hypothetical protein
MTISTSTKQSEPKLNSLRLLCTLYNTLAREFTIDLPALGTLETAGSAEETCSWLQSADGSIPVHQLRQFLQTSRLANRESLTAAIEYFLQKSTKDDADRDKIDFLLVQFLSHCASSQLQEADASLDFVARTLEPFLGAVEAVLPEPLRPLEALLKSASGCQSLLELYNSGILEQGRKLKISLASEYFQPQNLVAVTRFNFLMRRAFFQLMHRDLNAVLDGLRKLELKGVNTLDCRKAEFAEDEPIARLRMICQSWKVMFQAEYSSGQPLRILADLRGVVDARLNESIPKSEEAAKTEAKPAEASSATPVAETTAEAPVEAPKAQAASASASSSGNSSNSGSSSKPHGNKHERRGKRK